MRTLQRVALLAVAVLCIVGAAVVGRRRGNQLGARAAAESAAILYRKGADALLGGGRWTAESAEAEAARLREIEVHAQRQEDANKALEGVLDQLDVRRRELVAIEESLRNARSHRSKAEEDLRLARSALSELRKNVSRLQGEKRKVAKLHERVVAAHEAKKKQVSEEEAKRRADESFKAFAFNEYQSSLLPLDRDIPDTRVGECQALDYDVSALPKTSVIICFVNEAWSALLRTVYSVINRAPHELIQEIILVDDGSDAEWLGGKFVPKLREYINTTLPPEVRCRVVTSPRRLGLIRARLLGAEHAKGPVLTFLDSHVEANRDWAQPILALIGADKRTVVTPVIDTIDAHTMEHASWAQRVPAVGTFSWTMDFTWKAGVMAPGAPVTDPIDSPTMAGGLFAIDKSYFKEIGTYDEDMDGWGGENLEMSFRIWTCGGRLVTAPCSHFGHIFRETHPYTIPNSSIHETFMKNSARVAEVWMDDYKRFFYQSRANTQIPDFGDVTKRKALRKRLKCKPFKWYMDTILPTMFIPDDEHIKDMGAIRNPARGQCIDKMGQRAGGVAGVYFCHGQGGNQAFLYSVNNEIRTTEDLCLDAWGNEVPGEVHLQNCHGSKGNQEFNFAKVNGDMDGDRPLFRIVHVRSSHCLEVRTSPKSNSAVLRLNTCSSDANAAQRWRWDSTKALNSAKQPQGKR